MDAVWRAAAIYFFLLLMFRIAGRRTLAQLSNFDFALLLIIGEATQQGLLGEDFSVTRVVLVIATLVVLDVGLAALKQRSATIERWLDGAPLIILVDGQPLTDRMRKARLDIADILHAARRDHGLERLDQIRFAILECNGGISVIPAHA